MSQIPKRSLAYNMFVDSIVGWVGLVLTIAGLINPSQVPNAKIRVKIQTGKDGNGLNGAGGHIPSITLDDTSNRRFGEFNARNKPKRGSDQYWNHDISTSIPSELKILDVKMEHFYLSGSQIVKGSLNDGPCLAYLSWTPEDVIFNAEARKGAITGDLFYFYGHSWYPSGKNFGGKDLRCGWMDGDNTNGNSVYGMLLNTDILGSGYIGSYADRNPNPKDICYWGVSFSTGSTPRKRSIKDTYGTKAYVTSGGGAIEICDSPTSWGPSMLSLEQGIFCDMVTKTKMQICGRGKKEGCVKYNCSQNKLGRPQRTMTANSVSRNDISHGSYDLEYFVISDINGTVTDDGHGQQRSINIVFFNWIFTC
ncbi:hypothetical protein BGX27_010539 [Mortierella sp. AM989]|nr:hypothetical protein BGX27_010539 [Mortierella sp. AM989]